ncbi:replication protein P [Marinomonas spartinae]|nr:replication protein P [Marinomonas spartinae]
MKEPQAVQNLVKPLANKLATPSATSTTQTGEQASYQSQQQDEAQQQTRVLVNMLFARFKAIYTHKFASAYSTPDEVKLAKREWAVALKGFQEPLLAYAVERTKEVYAWPPTISEFLKLIHTAYKAYGLLDPRTAYYEACQCRSDPLQYKWTHPAVYFAGAQTGWYKLKTEEERISWPLFEANYLKIVDRVISGERLSIPKVFMIEDKQTLDIDELIRSISKALSLAEEEIAPMFYYIHKTPGSGIRKQYRKISKEKLKVLGYTGALPE